MLLIPSPRSDTNASDRPSGAQAGLTFLPWSMCLSSSIRPSSRWYSPIRMLPNLSVLKSVAPPRSVVNAIVFPSGDHADLEPAWSPDGKTIAFTTDRGGATDFSTLKFGNMRIGLYHLDDGRIELLKHMDQGKNVNPAWAPDGRSLAFVSDRGDGISNIFLYEFADGNVYQLTDVYTGVTGITPLSPCLSWAHEA